MTSMSGHSLVPNILYPTFAASNVQHEHGSTLDNVTEALQGFDMNHGGYGHQVSSTDDYTQAKGSMMKQGGGNKAQDSFMYQWSSGLLPNANLNVPQDGISRLQQPYNWVSGQHTFQTGPYQSYGHDTVNTSSVASRGQPWLASQYLPPVPDLIEPRRASLSSRDDTSPQTPNFGHAYYGHQHGRSPSLMGSKYDSTPSPLSPSNAFLHWRKPDGDYVVIDFWSKMNQDPPVPEPVPALHSGPDGGRGTLDKILDNRDGTTNVYIRGLQPDTSDEMLLAYGKRFGDVISCKSIIDATTGHCKGFGFVKYHNFVDAENCIRGFYARGYEAKFAKKSHNSRLKDLARVDNTNLYVSNLPKGINEEGLKRLFQTIYPDESYPHHQAGSCKILKDTCGVSRGVGFARFETPRICEEIIAAFNNRMLGEGDETTMLQIRYADTDDQKKLKAETALRRQFKADEYNQIVYGTAFGHTTPDGIYHSPNSPVSRAQGVSGSWTSHSPNSTISPPGFGNYPHSALRTRQTSSHGNGLRTSSGALEMTPVAEEDHASPLKIESPSVSAAMKRSGAQAAKAFSTAESASSISEETTFVENPQPTANRLPTDAVISPAKPKL